MRDLRLALRSLRRSPGFTLLAAVTLGVAIGANTTVFTWIESLVFRPLPGVPDDGRVFAALARLRSGEADVFAWPEYEELRDGVAGVADLVAYDLAPVGLRLGAEAERAWAVIASDNLFAGLRVGAARGRTFLPRDGEVGAPPVAVLSHRFWSERLDADPGAVGRTLTVNGRPFTVVGVAAEGFRSPYVGLTADLFVPLATQPIVKPGDRRLRWDSHWLEAMARLRPGVSRERAAAALSTVAARLAAERPATNAGRDVALYRFWQAPWGPSKVMFPVLSALWGMMALVLLLACANVANLMLARALRRRRELAIRLALGASRARVVRQLLLEAWSLALLAAALGLLVAAWGARLILAFVPPSDVPIDSRVGLDPSAFVYACALTLLAALAFGLAPALQSVRPDLVPALRSGAGSVAGDRRGSRLRAALVVVQVALSLVLLVGAGLFARALERGRAIPPGFAADGLLLGELDLFPNGYGPAEGRVFLERLQERLAALPGVDAAALARRVPLDFAGFGAEAIEVEGRPARPGEPDLVRWNAVSPGYFATMGVVRRAGRDFTAADRDGVQAVAVVNETLAARFWPDGAALGRRLRVGEEELIVVGIVADHKVQSLGEAPQPVLYYPLAQRYGPDVVVHLRTGGDPAALGPAVRSAVADLDPALPVFAVKTMRAHLGISVLPQRLAAAFMGVLGSLALLLACVGVYGLVAYAASQRTREMGLRLALGARPGDLRRLVLRQGVRLAAAGVACGALGALAVGRLLAGLLLGASATDPWILAGAPLLLAALVIAASDVPARRAGRTHPMVALRDE